MKELYGVPLKKQEITKRVGDMSQLADARLCELESGRGRGVRAVELKTGSGLNATILPDRGMDIAWAEYKGVPLAYISKAGVCSPWLFEEPGFGFMRNFTCGLLTTCGIANMGAVCTDQGKDYGLHGRISNIPAEDIGISKEWEGDDYVIRIRGKVRESAMFGENFTLTREISTKLGDTKITLHDTIENCSFQRQPYMILYHYNFGFPLVSATTKVYHSEGVVSPRDETARSGFDSYDTLQTPVPGFSEHCFNISMKDNRDDMLYACLFNRELNMGAYIRYRKNDLDYLNEWKQMGEGDYVFGWEPSNCLPEGREKARSNNRLPYLEPGETREYRFEIGVLENAGELAALGVKKP